MKKEIDGKAVVSIMNDLIADNEFNTDNFSKDNIEKDINSLCKDLGINKADLKEDNDERL